MIPKYRAWFSEASHMITDNLESINFPDETVTITSGYYDSFADDYIFGSMAVAIGNAILMQSTGLFDKNGVEIFEGDILTWESHEMAQSTWIGTVFRNGAEFSVRKSKKTYSTGAWLNSACRPTNNIITVIGDIHQNPELLEGSHA